MWIGLEKRNQEEKENGGEQENEAKVVFNYKILVDESNLDCDLELKQEQLVPIWKRYLN